MGKAHPFHSAPDEPDPVLCHIAAVQCALPLHLLGQQQRFTAGCRTEVDHGIAGLCLHTEGCQLAGLPLHMETALLEERVLRRAALELCQHTAGYKAGLRALHAAFQQLFAEGFRRPLQGVGPEAGQAAVGGVGQDAQRFLGVMGAQKLCHILPRRAQHHEALGLVPEAGSFQIIIAGFAQDGIDQPGRTRLFEGAGQLDRFVHRRRHRHLHIAGLRQRGPQDLAHLRVQPGKALGQELFQNEIQRALMFQHGVEDGTGKGLIPALQFLAAEFGIQHKV